MKRVIIVQARNSSARLPGKVMMDLAGQPMLTQQIRRLKDCQRADDIVIATTTSSTDDPVVSVAENEDVRWFRGSETDVLSRYAGAAGESHADIIVRVTADCPLIDPEQTDSVIETLEAHESECDYASNTTCRTFPRGLDTEVFFRDVLERVDRLATSRPAREHVTYFINVEQPNLFLRRSVIDAEDNSDLRWTVDMPADLLMVTRLYTELNLNERALPYRHILNYVRQHADIAAINAHIEQKLS